MKKNFITKLKEIFSETEVDESTVAKFVDVKTTEGRIFRVDGDIIAVDAKVQEILEDGTVADVEDGTFVLEDESTITLVGSIITEVVESATEDTTEGDVIEDSPEDTLLKKLFSKTAKENFAIIKEISKWEISVDNTTFTLGDKVTYTYDEVQYNVNDGEYELEDGSKIFIDSDGIIVLIKDATDATPVETAPADTAMTEEEDATFAKINEVVENFKSLQTKYSKLESDFEAFKKEASTKHTDLTINFDGITKEKPKSILHSMLNK